VRKENEKESDICKTDVEKPGALKDWIARGHCVVEGWDQKT
jgi:hypothetical protein